LNELRQNATKQAAPAICFSGMSAQAELGLPAIKNKCPLAGAFVAFIEVPSGFEPLYKVLQTSA
jgi:hypothetical protein